MKNIKFSRLFAAMMFVAVLSFAGCKQQPEETPTIYGTWMSQYDEGYKITDTTIEYIDKSFDPANIEKNAVKASNAGKESAKKMNLDKK